MTSDSLRESVGPILHGLLSFLKVGALVAIPIFLGVFCIWFAFIRWSQHGVDL